MKRTILFCALLINTLCTVHAQDTTLVAHPDTLTQIVNEVTHAELLPLTGFSFTTLWRGILGMIAILSIAFLFSKNKRKINWKQVSIGLVIQMLLAIGILYVPFIGAGFELVGKIFVKILDFTRAGSSFLLGDLVDLNKTSYIFIFQVLPTIIFFSALTSLLFYLGVIQKVVYVIAWALKKSLGISGAEGLTAAGNIFLGQTEAPLMIKKYLPKMNLSEIFLIMTTGMATIAGGVLAAYVGMLGGGDPALRLFYAKHLLSASVMAAPGAIVLAKIIMPQTEPINSDMDVSSESVGTNILDVISNGATEGIRLAVNVAGMLLVFIAFVAFINYIFGGLIGRFTGLNDWIATSTNGNFKEFSLEYILGMVFTPLTWLMGVAKEDMQLVAGLLGKKLILNEFVAYGDLGILKAASSFAYEKSVVMSTYILCGFANISSIGIIIGGVGTLAPNTRPWLTKYGALAMMAGALASCLSATIVGMLL